MSGRKQNNENSTTNQWKEHEPRIPCTRFRTNFIILLYALFLNNLTRLWCYTSLCRQRDVSTHTCIFNYLVWTLQEISLKSRYMLAKLLNIIHMEKEMCKRCSTLKIALHAMPISKRICISLEENLVHFTSSKTLYPSIYRPLNLNTEPTPLLP